MELKFDSEKEAKEFFSKHYKEKKSWKIPDKVKKALLAGSPFLICAIVLFIAGMGALDVMFPPEPFSYSWNGIAMFLSICAGLAWVLHGFGFILVRR